MCFVTFVELKFHHLPVREFDSPSLQQMHELHRIVCQAQEKHEVSSFQESFLCYIAVLVIKFLFCRQKVDLWVVHSGSSVSFAYFFTSSISVFTF